MSMNRREFVTLATGSIALTVLTNLGSSTLAMADGPRNNLAKEPFDAGEVGKYAKAGVYDDFAKDKGVWLVSDGKILTALSGSCTHAGGALEYHEDRKVFVCLKHQAEFTPEGDNSPGFKAKRPLERCSISLTTGDKPQVHIDPTKRFRKDKDEWTKPEASLTLPA